MKNKLMYSLLTSVFVAGVALSANAIDVDMSNGGINVRGVQGGDVNMDSGGISVNNVQGWEEEEAPAAVKTTTTRTTTTTTTPVQVKAAPAPASASGIKASVSPAGISTTVAPAASAVTTTTTTVGGYHPSTKTTYYKRIGTCSTDVQFSVDADGVIIARDLDKEVVIYPNGNAEVYTAANTAFIDAQGGVKVYSVSGQPVNVQGTEYVTSLRELLTDLREKVSDFRDSISKARETVSQAR